MRREILSYGAARRSILFFSFILLLAQVEDVNADMQSIGLLFVDLLVAVSLLFVIGLLAKAKNKRSDKIIIDAVIVLLAFEAFQNPTHLPKNAFIIIIANISSATAG